MRKSRQNVFIGGDFNDIHAAVLDDYFVIDYVFST